MIITKEEEFVIESYPAADDQQTASQGVESHDCLFSTRGIIKK
jgi:hypothetical protein